MDLISGLFKVLYWPLCRAYARYLGDRPADALLRCLCKLQFRMVHGFWPNFLQPRRFSEKVLSLQLHNRDTRLTLVSDKLSVRSYVAKNVGSDYLIPLLWKGDKPEDIPFDTLPSQFVIKTNHGCGYNIIVKDKAQLDLEKCRLQVNKWVSINFCSDTFLGIPWGYKNIRPHIVIESFLQEDGKAPVDYKFWCFNGRVETISLHFDRFINHTTLSFDRDFEPGGFSFGLPLYSGKYELPSNYKTMLRVAESLAEGFDFIRVDLYNIDGKIYFSELTPYPGGVSAKFDPESLDCALGEKWDMEMKQTPSGPCMIDRTV